MDGKVKRYAIKGGLVQQILHSSLLSQPPVGFVEEMVMGLLRSGVALRGGAIRLGNYPLVDILLRHGAIPSGKDMIEATHHGPVPLVETLFTHSVASHDRDWGGFLEAALLSKNPEMVKTVSKRYPASYDPGVLCTAIQTRRALEFVQELVANRSSESPAHVLQGTSIAMATKLGDLHLLRFLMDHLPLSETAIPPPEQWLAGKTPSTKPFWRLLTGKRESPLNTALHVGE